MLFLGPPNPKRLGPKPPVKKPKIKRIVLSESESSLESLDDLKILIRDARLMSKKNTCNKGKDLLAEFVVLNK